MSPEGAGQRLAANTQVEATTVNQTGDEATQRVAVAKKDT
jgi:hypothetical protein